MLNDATIAILLTMNDQATPRMKNVERTMESTRVAFRQLSMSVAYLGASFMAMGIALEKSQDPLVQSMGRFLSISGSIMTAIGTVAHFIYSIQALITALKALQIQSMVTQAFLPGIGWATLAAGAIAVGGIAIYQANQGQNINIDNKTTVMLDGKQLGSTVRRDIVLNQQRNAKSGVQ